MAERLVGVNCSCGGEVWFQNLHEIGGASRAMAWEAWCRKCRACDCNGYSTRRELLAESAKFWTNGRAGTIQAEVRR